MTTNIPTDWRQWADQARQEMTAHPATVRQDRASAARGGGGAKVSDELAGRELASAVEAALGWTGIRPGMLYERYGLRPGSSREEMLPDYLPEQGIGAAWECVEWLRERGWRVSRILESVSEPSEWAVEFSERKMVAYRHVNSTGSTLAEAICTCFLAVVAAHPELRGQG